MVEGIPSVGVPTVRAPQEKPPDASQGLYLRRSRPPVVPFVFRLVKKKWASSAFSGEGARLYGGRWTSPGVSVVYTAGSLALGQLEILVHLPTDRLLKSYVAFQAAVPDACIDVCPPETLPASWRLNPAPEAAKRVGDAWAKESRSAVLQVPSAVVPSESCFLLNPEHEDFGQIEISGPFDPGIDERLVAE